jgi:alkylhydroperoxidase family enzyme
MLRVTVPEGSDPIIHAWGVMVPGIGPAAASFSQAVYEHHTVELETFEAARLRIAQLNGCIICKSWRTEVDGETVDDAFFEAVDDWRASPALADRPRLAAEFAERYVNDHHGIDDAFFARLREHFSEAELVELAMCIGSWVAFGRLNRIFGLDETCQLPSF